MVATKVILKAGQVIPNNILLGTATDTSSVPTAVTGSSLAAFSSGSGNFKWVVAIEGYPWIITDAATAKAVTAWAGTDWQQALPGLFVDLNNDQRIDPWKPFQPGGTLKFHVQAESIAADTFGVDTHRKASGAETTMTATANRASIGIGVLNGPAFTGLSEAFIGTECIGLASAASGLLWTSQRGKYSPFKSGGLGGAYFAEHHRISIDPTMVKLSPTVSAQPRVWSGKRVGLWLHKADAAGNLNSKADALCVFAGRITDIGDDPGTGYTVVSCKHELAAIQEATIGRDLFRATVINGFRLVAGTSFGFQDNADSGVWKHANPLVVVASGAAGANQVNAGYYSLEQICSFVTTWLAAERAAGRLFGTYSLVSPESTTNGPRTVMHWRVPGTGADAWWVITWPDSTWGAIWGTSSYQLFAWGDGSQATNAFNTTVSDASPMQAQVFQPIQAAQALSVQVSGVSGSFVDQYALLPSSIKSGLASLPNVGGLQWGLFLFNEKMLLVGSFDGSGQVTQLFQVPDALNGLILDQNSLVNYRVPLGDASPTIRQVLLLSGPFNTVMKNLFYGTGTPGYNHATYDVAGYGLGLGIPADLLGPAFEQSLDNLPNATHEIVCFIDETTKLVDLFSADMILRRATVIWKNGGVRFGSFATPTTAAAVATLQEANKAEPSGGNKQQRSASVQTNEWTRDIVKIDYDRDFTFSKNEIYRSVFTLEDGTNVDDNNGGTLITIKARNIYGQFANSGSSLGALLPQFLALQPLFSRAVRKTNRSIDMRYFEAITVLDIVLVFDLFARDPATGRRGISARPALVTHHRYNPGGPTPGDPTKSRAMVGEVDLFFLDVNRIAAYAPAAQLDDTANASGFTAGYNPTTKTIRCYQHQHSEPPRTQTFSGLFGNPAVVVAIPGTGEPNDATNFPAQTRVRVIQIDPTSPTSYLTWLDVVAAQSGDDITLTTGLPGFDTSKKYRIIFDRYSSDVIAQQSFTFQASSSNGLIENVAPAFQYGTVSESIYCTPNGIADKPEIHADIASGDGRGRDVGYERGLIRLLNGLCDYKTAHQSPMLSNTVLTNTTYSAGSGFQLLSCTPISLTREGLSSAIYRSLRVAPFFRSSDGTAVTIRVTLIQEKPTDATLNDIVRQQPYVDASWTTTSTAWQTGAEQLLNMTVKHPIRGDAWILIEGSIKTETRNLGKCIEGPRTVAP